MQTFCISHSHKTVNILLNWTLSRLKTVVQNTSLREWIWEKLSVTHISLEENFKRHHKGRYMNDQ